MHCHHFCVTLNANISNLFYTCCPVWPKYESKSFWDKIVEHLTIIWIWKLFAFSTWRILIIDATRANLAPSGFIVFMATLAFVLKISFTSSAVQSTICYQFGIWFNFFHLVHLLSVCIFGKCTWNMITNAICIHKKCSFFYEHKLSRHTWGKPTFPFRFWWNLLCRTLLYF